MKLRIISGTLRGRYLTIPQRDIAFRPTRERIRESVAGILSFWLSGAVVADVCAGSGGMGFEMISRGASSAMFVEFDRSRCQRISDQARQFGVDGQCRVVRQDVATFTKSCVDRFDIIYYDPPYDEPWTDTFLPALMLLLGSGGVLVYEKRSGKGAGSGAVPADMPQPFDRRVYGETEICLYRIQEPEVSSQNEAHET